ncbi:hypothetical protein GGTG_13703 [Gaeumannomyces tritici R3-111a-1]|uniref:Myb/SANT-like domain-containing protein n=1 Tax=Gaeumannomyces tritici (strain R3-111a-1) TaxID=644352 RepID=J3PJL6_GAET3|nr:hypothetical protein GGTG_13703 [Gaeumannomyces tritici R3-111a-1]EJT68729.1 hypothetical protein GGTG_13703 [Gaeumannomyces tritici R3-111a-1]
MPSYRSSLRLQQRYRQSQNRAQSEPPSDPPALDLEAEDLAEGLPATQATVITLGTSIRASSSPGIDSNNDFVDHFQSPASSPRDSPAPTDGFSDLPDSQQSQETSEVPSQASQEGGKRNDWFVDQLLAFLESLAESSRLGKMNPTIASWLSKCLKVAAADLSARWPSIRWSNRVKNKYNGLKSQYRDWVNFGNRSGVSLDPVTGLYVASDHAWEAFFAVRPNARWMQKKPLFRPDLQEAVFAGRWATGQQIATAAQRLAEESDEEAEEHRPAKRRRGGRESGGSSRLTLAEAQMHVGDRLLEAAQTLARAGSGPDWGSTPSSRGSSRAFSPAPAFGSPSRYYLREENWWLATKSLQQGYLNVDNDTKQQLIRLFRTEAWVAKWWLV